jgi:hypothetical protein
VDRPAVQPALHDLVAEQREDAVAQESGRALPYQSTQLVRQPSSTGPSARTPNVYTTLDEIDWFTEAMQEIR